MRLKLICTGSGDNSIKVVNADTGEEVENVGAVNFQWDEDDFAPILLIEVANPEAEIEGDGVILIRGRRQ